MDQVKNTPLLQNHQKLNGRIVEFAGFNMPLQYTSVTEEHMTVRESVGVFDVSHMGQVEFRGPQALTAARRMVTNNVEGLKDGQVLYSPICYPEGGIVDDCLVYRINAQHILFVVNASNIAKDYQWFAEQAGRMCAVENRSDEYALIAVQGRHAIKVINKIADHDLSLVPSFHFVTANLGGVKTTPSRTGYTGEDGFEIACAPADASKLWDAIFEAGAEFGIKACGLAARDTLRLEARLPLYGNDIDQTTTPLEAGLGWTVKLKAGVFIGQEALVKQKAEGIKRSLVCMEMRTRGIARHGHNICLKKGPEELGAVIGQVTSGTKSPSIEAPIAMGYVPIEHAEVGTRLLIDVRGKAVEAEVIKGPFYKRNY